MAGLGLRQKAIASTWQYDHRGCELAERITQLDAHDLARREFRILERCAVEIAAAAGPQAVVVELGIGSSRTTRQLLDALDRPQAYLPIDPRAEFLAASSAELASSYSGLQVLPIAADFMRIDALHELELFDIAAARGRRLVFVPGSTFGNFTPDAAVDLLSRICHAVGPDALLVVGTATTHGPALPARADGDPDGVIVAFNLNLLARINRELGADFCLDAFAHETRVNAEQQRIETHLVSRYTQRVTVGRRPFQFAMGESIHTDSAHAYSLLKFQHLAARAGWTHRQLWIHGLSHSAVHVLEQATTGEREQNVRFR